MNDDFLLDDDDSELNEAGYYQQPPPEDEDDAGDEEESSEEELTTKEYDGKLNDFELKCILGYDDIQKYGKSSEDFMMDALLVIVGTNPYHESSKTIADITRSVLGRNGHNRVANTLYTAEDTTLTGVDVDEDFLDKEDSKFNQEFTEEARRMIADFIDYLANRDLSKDSVFSRNRKLRNIPALIILLFSSNLYGLIVGIETLPKVYADQVDNAFNIITRRKQDIVEELARAYEERGRQIVADRVRRMGIAWFEREPAEIRVLAEFADLELTYDDVVLYREYRVKFTNSSKTITQDYISDLIEVVIDPEAGIYERLKDKTRSEAIADVKQIWKQWATENAQDSELAKKIIWKSI
ncbi:MAG: hypothetical protein J6I84_02540 [Bacilli bacterium]|nr:hypothetical protein [Bacilli bacterium]